MIFQSKVDRAMKWLKEKNQPKREDNLNGLEDEMSLGQEQEKIEKRDILAILISALLVFGPIILVLLIITFLMV
ncbi:MAG: hypothetical protein GX461_09090 [Clostridiales bacterium]|jgi:hypothetical protein|nr:hypothetical protein [Clostridia bacterium]MDI9512376.1 hypothetical protein [Bacillota bacterium]NLH59545.1 hypothetical protein [Clostridiales bacterium]